MNSKDIAELLSPFSAREMFDELIRRGAIDYVDCNTIIDGRHIRDLPPERKKVHIQQTTLAQIQNLAGWLAENGVIITAVQTLEPDTDPMTVPPRLRDLPPGSCYISTGIMARVPSYDMDDL